MTHAQRAHRDKLAEEYADTHVLNEYYRIGEGSYKDGYDDAHAEAEAILVKALEHISTMENFGPACFFAREALSTWRRESK